MLDALKPLLESGIINEDIKTQLSEAWDNQLNEVREQVRAELREEFAGKYEHDRSVMVEALDKMVTDCLSEEIKEFHEERKALNEDRVKAKVRLNESVDQLHGFFVQKMAEELKELREDRKAYHASIERLQEFVVQALAKELTEFAEDKRALVEAKVKLVTEGKDQIAKLKRRFVTESAKQLSKYVTNRVSDELLQLKEDIKVAKENHFGRKIYEAFASEFSVSHLNDKAETKSLLSKLQDKEQQLAEANRQAEEARRLAESVARENRIIKESTRREKVLSNLLAPLNKEKAAVMKSLLESVDTSKLNDVFNKYLPSVLNTSTSGRKSTIISEGLVEVTGNKTAISVNADTDSVNDIKRLAGLQ